MCAVFRAPCFKVVGVTSFGSLFHKGKPNSQKNW